MRDQSPMGIAYAEFVERTCAAAPRGGVTWARPVGKRPPTFCAIADIRSGCVSTYCKGRWSTSESVELYSEPRQQDRCERCGGCLIALGLRELATAPAVDMRGTVEIDFSEVEG